MYVLIRVGSVVLLFGIAFAQTGVEQPRKVLDIHGSAVDACGDPIANGTVRLTDAKAKATVAFTKTDADREFAFVGVPSTDYDVHFEASGFEPLVKAITSAEATDINIVVGLNRIDLVLCFSPASVPYYRAPTPNTLSPQADSNVVGATNRSDPIPTTVCELMKEPERFNGQIVRVRGRVRIAFEDFRLDTAQCDGKHGEGVWLEYGKGPKRQPTTWCCGDMIPRDPLRLMEDSNFKAFHRFLTAQSRRKGCYEGQCYLYEVTATLTGRFDSVETVTCSNGKSECPKHGGFGHFGSFTSRIVIESVSDVDAKRTGDIGRRD